MPRPKRPRRIASQPLVREFRPKGIQAGEEVLLSLEEYEAVRLIDYDGLDQSQAAKIMDVSRQTVGRILRAGRFKLATALVRALPLKVSGGCYRYRRGDQGPSGRGRGRQMGRCRMGNGKHLKSRS
mgnify:CR=1 FL=1